MNKMWVWVGFPFGIGLVLLLLVFALNEAGAEIRYKTVMTDKGAESRIGFVDKKPGTGAVIKDGDTVMLSFISIAGKAVPRKNPPEPWNVGESKLGPGFDQGIVGMKEGGIREIIVPPELMRQEMMRGGGGEMVFEVQVGNIVPNERDMPLPPGHP